MRRLIAALPLVPLLMAVPPAHADTQPTGPKLLLISNSQVDVTDSSFAAITYRIDIGASIDPSVSADGSRFAVTQTSQHVDDFQIGPDEGSTTTSIALFDVGGALLRVFDTATRTSGGTGGSVRHPAPSPSGQALVWERDDADGPVLVVGRLGTDGNAVLSGTGGLTRPVVVGDDLELLALSGDGHLVARSSTGDVLPVSGITDVLRSLSVSADGGTLALERADGTLTSASLTRQSDGHFTAGPQTTLFVGYDSPEPPQLSRDSSTVYWVQRVSTGIDAYSVPTAGGPAADRAPGGDLGWTAVLPVLFDQGTKPGPVTLQPAVLGGTSVTLNVALPADSDYSYVSVIRTGGGDGSVGYVVPAPLRSLRITGLKADTHYHFVLLSHDRSGNTNYSDRHVDVVTTAAVATFFDPTSRGSTTTPFRVGFGTAASYDVAYRTNGAGGFTPWVTGGTARSLVFGKDGGTTSVAGNSYAFRVTAHDTYGNSTAPTVLGTAVVPTDQNAMTFTGKTASTGSAASYFTTERVLRDGATATFSGIGDRVQVIGSTCPTCGRVEVLVDDVQLGFLNDRSGQRVDKVLLLSRLLHPGRHTVRLVAHGDVVLDGYAFRR